MRRTIIIQAAAGPHGVRMIVQTPTGLQGRTVQFDTDEMARPARARRQSTLPNRIEIPVRWQAA